MSSAPAGAIVRFYIDLKEHVAPGAEIRTATTGRRYQVIAVRIQLTGRRVGRQHLTCIVLDKSDPPSAGATHMIRWYKRARSKR